MARPAAVNLVRGNLKVFVRDVSDLPSVLAALEASPMALPDTTFKVMHDTVMTIIDAAAKQWPQTRFRNLHDALRHARQHLPAKLHKQLSMMNKAYSFMKHMPAHDVATLGDAFVTSLSSCGSNLKAGGLPDNTTCRDERREDDSKSCTSVSSDSASARSSDTGSVPLPRGRLTDQHTQHMLHKDTVPARQCERGEEASKGGKCKDPVKGGLMGTSASKVYSETRAQGQAIIEDQCDSTEGSEVGAGNGDFNKGRSLTCSSAIVNVGKGDSGKDHFGKHGSVKGDSASGEGSGHDSRQRYVRYGCRQSEIAPSGNCYAP
jgi:hypothetical protein